MSISRIFQAVSLSVGTTIQLDEPASHHLARVLRAKVTDNVIIFNGEGGEYQGVITQITKKNVAVQIEHLSSCSRESPLDLWLVQGISRGEKMDYTIQKAVELGAKKIIPVFTERCTVKLDQERREKRWQHWQSIMISACEQCGRTEIPTLDMPVSLSDWLKEKCEIEMAFVLTPLAETKLKEITIQPSQRTVLLIGPEGGLTEAEIDSARQKGFRSLSLGPRVLRTETAAVAALTALQSFFGDMA